MKSFHNFTQFFQSLIALTNLGLVYKTIVKTLVFSSLGKVNHLPNLSHRGLSSLRAHETNLKPNLRAHTTMVFQNRTGNWPHGMGLRGHNARSLALTKEKRPPPQFPSDVPAVQGEITMLSLPLDGWKLPAKSQAA